MKNEYKAAVYLRVACEDNLALEAQTDVVTQFAHENGFADCRYYCDNGASGTTLNRPSMSRLMTDISNGEIKTVIVKDLSRLCRGIPPLVEFQTFAEAHGVKVISVQDGGLEDWASHLALFKAFAMAM